MISVTIWFSAGDGQVTWKHRRLMDAREFILAPPAAGKPFLDALLELDESPGAEYFDISLDWGEHALSKKDFASTEAWRNYLAMMDNAAGSDLEIVGAEVGAVHIEFGMHGARESFLAALAAAEAINGLSPG